MDFIALGHHGPYPVPDGACSSYIVRQGEKKILFDIGTGTLPRLLKVLDPCCLDAIFISHWHADHCADLFPLSYYYQLNLEAGKKIKLYTIDTSASHLYQEAKNIPYFEWREIGSAEEIAIGEMKIRTENARHPIPALMFTVLAEQKKLVYTSDTNYFEALPQFCAGADVLICDACILHQNWNEQLPHLSAKLAGELAKQADVKQLLLTHLSPLVHEELIFYEAFAVFERSSVVQTEKLYQL